jgi:hypothetical protein
LISYPNFAVEEGDHVVGQRYEWPPRLFFNPQHSIASIFLCVLATSHGIFHRPHFAVIGKFEPCGFALHAPVPGHGLFAKSHCLEG